MSNPETRIKRSVGATLGFAAGGLVALALSAFLFKAIVEGPMTFGIALLPGILGLILLGMAVGGSGVAPCPGCGAEITGLSTGSNDGVLCAGCKAFVEGKEGTLRLTDVARIADAPLFGAMLPESFGWPEGCCVCAGPAARRDSISVDLPSAAAAGKGLAVTALTGGVVTQTGGGTRYTIDVPHCADHKDGAALGSGSGRPVRIRFRSYPYLRSFCDLNKITPG
jgi:hypothetical protein